MKMDHYPNGVFYPLSIVLKVWVWLRLFKDRQPIKKSNKLQSWKATTITRIHVQQQRQEASSEAKHLC